MSGQTVGDGRNRGLRIAVIALGVALLVALGTVAVLFATRSSAAPPSAAAGESTPAPTNSALTDPATSTPATPTSPAPKATTTPSPHAAASSTAAKILSFSTASSVACSLTPPKDQLQFSWSSKNAKAAYFGVNTSDALTGGMGWVLPPTGTSADFPDGYVPYHYPCPSAKTTFTLTIVGVHGDKHSMSITVAPGQG